MERAAETERGDPDREDGDVGRRPMLVLVTDDAELSAGARAGDRDVRSWAPGAAAPAGARTFGGDPTRPESFAWAADAPAVTAVIALEDAARANAVMRAVRRVRSDAAVLILHDEVDHVAGDGTLARAGRLRDVLRLDLDEELHRLEAQRRLFCMRAFAERAAIVPILMHPAPDPDALASAFAVRVLLGRDADAAPIVTLAESHRPESGRMARLLKLAVVRITAAELRGFERVIAVDHQPTSYGSGGPRLAVLDHHPREHGCQPDYADIRPDLGATATIATQYVRADPTLRLRAPLATALLYGIKTDTAGLTRGVTPADVEAYAFLQSRADLMLLRRFERPSYPYDTARELGAAVARSRMDRDLVLVWLGRIDADAAHHAVDLADLCLSIEGAIWAAVAAHVDDRIVLTLRHQGVAGEAGEIAKKLAFEGGMGGGHTSMARVEWPAESVPEIVAAGDAERAADAVLRRLRRALDDEVSPRR